MATEQNTNDALQRGIPRRSFLKGVGVTMALPWLESLSGWAVKPAEAAVAEGVASAAAIPQRFGVLFMGNGVNPDHWWAKGQGEAMELGKTLEPLLPLKKKLNIINGLFNKNSTGLGIHPAMTGNLLTGVPIEKGAIIHSGISMDQMLANRIGQDTPQASMVLACEQPMTGYHETNYSNAYGSHISWQSADSPVPNEMYPSLAFDALFDNHGSLRNKSVLDRVNDRAKQLGTKISGSDKAKLDEYLTSVRSVERDIERMRANKSKAEDHANGAPLLSLKRPNDGLPEDLREHTKLMCDLIAMAFQTDKTRVASLILARDLSNLYYPFLDVREAHHGASHNDTSAGYERIARFHLSQYAYLIQKLDSMPEGDGTVLDHSCLMYMSNMFSGSQHDNSHVPMILAGGLSGKLETGRTMDYQHKGDENRRLCSLYMSIMDRMGVKLTHFGDADAQLVGL